MPLFLSTCDIYNVVANSPTTLRVHLAPCAVIPLRYPQMALFAGGQCVPTSLFVFPAGLDVRDGLDAPAPNLPLNYASDHGDNLYVPTDSTPGLAIFRVLLVQDCFRNTAAAYRRAYCLRISHQAPGSAFSNPGP